MKNQTYFIFILLLSALISCADKQNKPEKAKAVKPHKLSQEVQAAADSLSKITHMSGNGVLRFKNLMAVASVDDLVLLTDDKNAIVRCYAFYGLETKKYKKLRDIFYNHLKDSAFVKSRHGCFVDNISVMELMLREFHPAEKRNQYRLSEKEYGKYSRIAGAYKKNRKPKPEPNWEEQKRELQSYELLYEREYYWGSSKNENYEAMKKQLLKKNIAFKCYENMVIATAYFDVNGCNSHYPNVERKGDTVILKNQMLNKYPCDEPLREMAKITFVIDDSHLPKIKTVIAE